MMASSRCDQDGCTDQLNTALHQSKGRVDNSEPNQGDNTQVCGFPGVRQSASENLAELCHRGNALDDLNTDCSMSACHMSSASAGRKDEEGSRTLNGSRSRIKNGVSFVRAVHAKYQENFDPVSETEDIVIIHTSGNIKTTASGTINLPKHVSMSGQEISVAGSQTYIHKMCTCVTELDLMENNLTSWEEVFTIIECIPHLTFLNLTNNKLTSELPTLTSVRSRPLPCLTHLVLNNTGVTWDTVGSLLVIFPRLVELHLSRNNYNSFGLSTSSLPHIPPSEVLQSTSLSTAEAYKSPSVEGSLTAVEAKEEGEAVMLSTSSTPSEVSQLAASSAEEGKTDSTSTTPSEVPQQASPSQAEGATATLFTSATQSEIQQPTSTSAAEEPWASSPAAEVSKPSAPEGLSVVKASPAASEGGETPTPQEHLALNSKLENFHQKEEETLSPTSDETAVCSLQVTASQIKDTGKTTGILFPPGVTMDTLGLVEVASLSATASTTAAHEGDVNLPLEFERITPDTEAHSFDEPKVVCYGLSPTATATQPSALPSPVVPKPSTVPPPTTSTSLPAPTTSTPTVSPKSPDTIPESTSTTAAPLPSEQRPSVYPTLRRLFFSGNCVTDWQEISNLGRFFPNLEYLLLSETGVDSLGKSACIPICFPQLKSLGLGKTTLSSWQEVEKLSVFPNLTDVRLSGVPFLEGFPKALRFWHTVALLPNIVTLNGSKVGTVEREDAERAYLRQYMNEEVKPERYHALERQYGRLDPLVNVKLKPRRTVKLLVRVEDTGEQLVRQEEMDIELDQTVRALRKLLSNMAGRPAGKLNMFYMDNQINQGLDRLIYMDRKLHSYCMRDGDEIIVAFKD